MELMSSVSSYRDDSTSDDNIEDVSVVVVVAPIGFTPTVEADPPAPDGLGMPGPGSLGNRLFRRFPSPLRLAEARLAASLRLRAVG